MKMNRTNVFRPTTLFSLAFALLTISFVAHPAIAAAPKSTQKKTAPQKPVLKLTVAEARYLKKLEKQLVTKLNSKTNPADRNTWYVLLLLDRAVVQRETASKSGSSLSLSQSMWVSTKPDGVVVKGRREAALALARFLVGGNNAAKGMGRLAAGDAKTRTHVNADKHWRFYYFKSEKDAQALLARALPPKKKTK